MTFGPKIRRSGFTLVELLVVIAIIAVLAALALVAIIPFLGKGPEIQTVQEISQLSIAVQNFKNKYGVYPPSRIALGASPAAMDASVPGSSAMLIRIWPRIDWSGASGVIDWRGQNIAGQFILEGDQCLVFFLQGIPNRANGVKGFATDPKNPTKWNATVNDVSPPLFDFTAARLFKRGGSQFYSYYDVFGNTVTPFPASKPYLYFSSGKTYNGYSAAALLGVTPYITSGTTYANPNSFQIISAGANGPTLGFGPGGTNWTPNTGSYAKGGAGFDDLSNFCPNKLGVGP